jgi:chemotaxis family two-component system response regulator Rcp1
MSGLTVSRQGRSAIVLMVEDNPDHVFLARESFSEANIKVQLLDVDSGEKCLAFLRREPPFEDAPTPDLVLLDIRMPRMSGFDVMREISADARLRHLTVVVLSSSSNLDEVNRMYALGCKSFLSKPVDFAGFTEMIRRLSGYWLDMAILPQSQPG